MGGPRSIEPSDFQGAQLRQMREWLDSGSGAQGLFAAGDGWRAEQKYMVDLAQRVRDALKQAGAVMEGMAGEAMQNAVAPVVLWTEVTAENAEVQSRRLHEQGNAFNQVDAAVPKAAEIKPVPDDNIFQQGFQVLAQGKTDAAIAEAQNEKLRQEAVTAFSSYDSSSRDSVAGSAVFTPPPDGGMKTAVSGPTGTGSGHAGIGGSLSPVGSGGSAAGSGSSWAGGAGASPNVTSGAPGSTVPSGAAPGAGVVHGGSAGTRPASSTVRAGRAGAGVGRGQGSTSGTRRGSGTTSGDGGEAVPGPIGPGATAGRGGLAGVGARGAAGAPGMGAGGAQGRGRQGEQDAEHTTPDYLKGDHGYFDEGDTASVAPAVFGDGNR